MLSDFGFPVHETRLFALKLSMIIKAHLDALLAQFYSGDVARALLGNSPQAHMLVIERFNLSARTFRYTPHF